MYRRIDPIFEMVTPLLFAHRGGAKEVPESTVRGFHHAKRVGTDVFEIDIQLTRDEQMVVWHGPSLDNVRLAGEENRKTTRSRTDIGDYDWSELRDKAWVADPGTGKDLLNDVPKESDRHLLLFEEFLRLFPTATLNVEMKECFRPHHLKEFISVLNRNNPERVKVVASNRNESLLREFRTQTGGRFATNLPFRSLLGCRLIAGIGLLRFLNLNQRGLELPHQRILSPKSMIEQVRAAGGGTYVFLTRIPFFKSLDAEPNHPDRQSLFAILDRGVDGIMTDRPAHVRELMDRWIALHPFSTGAEPSRFS